MASAGCPWVSDRIRQPDRAGVGGRYTLVVSEHPGSGSNSPIGLDRKGVLHEHQRPVGLLQPLKVIEWK